MIRSFVSSVSPSSSSVWSSQSVVFPLRFCGVPGAAGHGLRQAERARAPGVGAGGSRPGSFSFRLNWTHSGERGLPRDRSLLFYSDVWQGDVSVVLLLLLQFNSENTHTYTVIGLYLFDNLTCCISDSQYQFLFSATRGSTSTTSDTCTLAQFVFICHIWSLSFLYCCPNTQFYNFSPNICSNNSFRSVESLYLLLLEYSEV